MAQWEKGSKNEKYDRGYMSLIVPEANTLSIFTRGPFVIRRDLGTVYCTFSKIMAPLDLRSYRRGYVEIAITGGNCSGVGVHGVLELGLGGCDRQYWFKLGGVFWGTVRGARANQDLR